LTPLLAGVMTSAFEAFPPLSPAADPDGSGLKTRRAS